MAHISIYVIVHHRPGVQRPMTHMMPYIWSLVGHQGPYDYREVIGSPQGVHMSLPRMSMTI